MKFIVNFKICILFLFHALMTVNVVISSKKSEKRKAKRLSKYGTESRLDFFTQNYDLFKGRYVYDFGKYGKYDALNRGNPTPIKINDRENHVELGKGGFGRVALVSKEGTGEEFIVKLLDVKRQNQKADAGAKTVAKSSILIKEQNDKGTSDYIMKYFAARTYECKVKGKKYNCAALLLEKVNGEELWSFLERK